MRSGELARLTGVSADTLRHYEKMGLLAPPHRAANGYREYSDATVARVRLIQRALDMGFSLTDLARVLRERDRGGAPCRQVRAIATARLQALDERIAELQRLRAELHEMVDAWDQRLAAIAPGQRAGLLDALAATPRRSSADRGLRRTKARQSGTGRSGDRD
jgi:DNA-binding transcriptional MerR regulator